MSNTRESFDIFIVGGGPRTTYMLRQQHLMLMDRFKNRKLPFEINISIAEPEMLGAGSVWSPLNNPEHQYCNTVANQLTACADQSVVDSIPDIGILDEEGVTFSEWLEDSFITCLDGYTAKWLGYYQHPPAAVNDNNHDIERWLDIELRPFVDAKIQKARQDAQEKAGEHPPAPIDEKDIAEQAVELWKRSKLEKWFNEKAYARDDLKCFKDGAIKIHNDYYAPRFLYGLYLHEMALDAVRKLSSNTKVYLNRKKVVDVDVVPNGHTTVRVELEDGQTDIVDQLVLLTGHHGKKPTEEQKKLIDFARSSGGVSQYQNPSTMLTAIQKMHAGDHLALEGMGLTAIDGIIAATVGKGGSFKRMHDGTLEYNASGQEPHIYTFSISGIPLAGRAVNHKNPQEISEARFFTLERIAQLRADKYKELKKRYSKKALSDAGITAENVQLHLSEQMYKREYNSRLPFSDLLPPIDPNTKIMKFDDSVICDLFRDMEYVFYKTTQGDDFAREYEECAYDPSARLELLMRIPTEDRLDFERLIDPVAKAKPTSASIFDQDSGNFQSVDSSTLTAQFSGSATNHQPFANSGEYQEFIVDYLESDIEHCRQGNKHGLKAATDMLRDLRDNLRALVDFGGLTTTSTKFFPLFSRLNSRLAVGPPHFRMEELLALSKAGVLTFMGPNTRIRTNPHSKKFQLVSDLVGSSSEDRTPHTVDVDIIVNTHGDHKMDIRRSQSELIQNMVRKGYLTPFVIQDKLNTQESTIPGGAAINRQYQVIRRGSDQEAIPQIHCPGITTEGTTTFKQNAARVGVGSTSIVEVTRVADQIFNKIALIMQPAPHTTRTVNGAQVAPSPTELS